MKRFCKKEKRLLNRGLNDIIGRKNREMGRAGTLEGWLRLPFFMEDGTSIISRLNLQNLFGTGASATTQPSGNPENKGRVESSSGYELGYLVYMDFFPRDRFTDEQLAGIDWSDRVNKTIHRGESRQQGGPYEAHTIDMNNEYIRLADGEGIPLDWRLMLAINPHDVFEDHSDIKSLAGDLKNMISQAKAYNLRKEPTGSIGLRRRIREKRYEIGLQFIGEWVEFIESLLSHNGQNTGERETLKAGGIFGLGIDDWLTRHTEERFFYQSIYPLHILHSVEDHTRRGASNPLQRRIMEGLGVTSGTEPLDYFQARVVAKGLDRIALSREIKPRFPKRSHVRELEKILQQDPYVVGSDGKATRLSEIYGGIRFTAEDMPRPYRLNILYRNFIVLQNVHLALRRYGQQIVQQQQQNPSAYDYLRLTLAIREALLAESGKIIHELKASYERDLSRSEIDAEQEALRLNLRDNPRFFEVITGKGAISRGTELDTIYRDRWAELDGRKMIENYRNVLEYEILLRLFSDSQRNIVYLHPDRTRFNMFTIVGLTDRLRPVTFNPRPYRV